MHAISNHLPNYSFYYTRLQITYTLQSDWFSPVGFIHKSRDLCS